MPFNGIDGATGQGIGWDYDALREICSRLNCVPIFVAAPWSGMLAAVSQGQFDMAADGITITAERAKLVAYSDAYMQVGERLAVRSDEARFQTLDDLLADGYIIGAQAETTNEALAIDLAGEDRARGFAEAGDAMAALLDGEVDAVVVDEYAGQGYSGAHADAVKLLPESLSQGKLGFVFPPGSALIEPVNRALAAMRGGWRAGSHQRQVVQGAAR